MTGKTYNEITQTSKCTSYTVDPSGQVEVWEDETTQYRCTWLKHNETPLPTTIYHHALSSIYRPS